MSSRNPTSPSISRTASPKLVSRVLQRPMWIRVVVGRGVGSGRRGLGVVAGAASSTSGSRCRDRRRGPGRGWRGVGGSRHRRYGSKRTNCHSATCRRGMRTPRTTNIQEGDPNLSPTEIENLHACRSDWSSKVRSEQFRIRNFSCDTRPTIWGRSRGRPERFTRASAGRTRP